MTKDKSDRFHAPLYERLNEHAACMPVSFHVPGHRYGRAWQHFVQDHDEHHIAARFGGLLPVDVTELSTTDDLHAPEDVIAESQFLAARVYGADHTFLLVGGSTAGNIGMILAVCEPGDAIIVQRNVHKSVLNGLRLAGATAVFLEPVLDPLEGTLLIPDLAAVEQALQQYPDAKAVLLSSPNYYGCSVPIGRYAACVHAYGIPLLIDEAHGAHYGLHPAFPPSALSQGADAVVQSTHKTLPAMTMGAMLHVCGSRINVDRLREMLAMVQSSSPSYPIMASLDIARAMIEARGSELFECGLREADRFKKHIRHTGRRLVIGSVMKVLPKDAVCVSKHEDKEHKSPVAMREAIERSGSDAEADERSFAAHAASAASSTALHDTEQVKPNTGMAENEPDTSSAMEVWRDPLRVTIGDRLGLMSGYELLRMLERHGCWAEMADERRVLLIWGPYVGEDETDRLIQACESIENELAKAAGNGIGDGVSVSEDTRTYETDCEKLALTTAANIQVVTDTQAVKSESRSMGEAVPNLMPAISEPVPFSLRSIDPNTIETVPAAEAAGCISADTIIPYPPGIPLVYAGERISEAMAASLVKLAGMGAKCQGAADASLRTVRITRV